MPRRSPDQVHVGDKIGRLTVTGPYYRKGANNDAWFSCRCDCGTEVEIRFSNLVPGKSCGCRQREAASKTWKKHGRSNTPLHRKWRDMRSRCITPTSTAYKNYGARGITVDPRWDDFEVFEAWALANGYDPKLDLDRIDNDGPYSPENCRFITRRQNLLNRRPYKRR